VKIEQKVVAYIVRDGQIIVFRHGDDESLDESGIQVPAGTVKPGEAPAEAVMREAFEETELPGLRLVRYLGVAEYDMRPAQDSLHVRHFFELTVDGDVPEQWTVYEHSEIRFDLYRIPLRQAHVVSAGQAAMVARLLA
jgi:8-oxo-dGTP pyrophosphatase MutT (NUDIX family)